MTDKVLDFNEKRMASIEQKRRSFERVLFQNFLGAYSTIDQDGVLYPVSLIDVSRDGCLFQVPWDLNNDKKFEDDKEMTMRMYFTKSSFIPAVLNVKYGKEFIDKDGQTYMHYGCEFDKSMPSFEALKNFIEFVYSFAEHSAIDRGDVKSYFF
ncbi:MAG: PilZ domain-containing protein [Bacteriovoracaceae bacterium]|jgi:hypothetical protein|nr:PilZ domain-containing protein [Bacteriovoracaceae bacterium]